MTRRTFVLGGAAVGALACVSVPRRASAADFGTVRGNIVLVRGHLQMPLDRAVEIQAQDFEGNPVGRVRYENDGAVLRYEITGLPLGGTLLVQLSLREDRFPETSDETSTAAVPLLARSDHSSPLYAFVLTHAEPVKSPLDFRVSVAREPAPLDVSSR